MLLYYALFLALLCVPLSGVVYEVRIRATDSTILSIGRTSANYLTTNMSNTQLLLWSVPCSQYLAVSVLKLNVLIL